MRLRRSIAASGLILVVVLALILTVQLANKGASGESVSLPAQIANQSATPEPTDIVDVEPTTPTRLQNAIADDALARTMASAKIRSGQPEVIFSQAIMGDALNDLGIGTWTFEPGCQISMQVVIIHGDFDVRLMQPGSMPDEATIPASYIIYVYDMRIGEPIATFSDPDGTLVNRALGKSSQSDANSSGLGLPTFPMPIPCDPAPVELPGAPAD